MKNALNNNDSHQWVVGMSKVERAFGMLRDADPSKPEEVQPGLALLAQGFDSLVQFQTEKALVQELQRVFRV